MYETRIIVIKLGLDLWYTAEVRRVYFLFRGKWKTLTPINQPSFIKAEIIATNYIYGT